MREIARLSLPKTVVYTHNRPCPRAPFPAFLNRDYIFSYIKKMRAHGDKVTPDRKYLTMETPFMEAYVKLLIHTCHRRGAFAMGGMAAQIPVKNNPKLAAEALESVKKDKVNRVVDQSEP